MYRPGSDTECGKVDELTSFTQFPPVALLRSLREIPGLLSAMPTYSEGTGWEFRIGYAGQFHCLEERETLHFPGVAQLSAGIKLNLDDKPLLSSLVLGYDPSYFVPQSFGWYVSAGFYVADWRTSNHLTFQTGAGLSMMPLGMVLAEGGESPPGLFLRSVRIRLGARFNPFHLSDHLGNITWESSIDFRVPWLFGHRFM
jgi:hypothetical protein